LISKHLSPLLPCSSALFFQATINCVAIDAPPETFRIMRCVAGETKGQHVRISSFMLRQQLLWDWNEEETDRFRTASADADVAEPSVRAELELSAGCLPPPGAEYVPLLAARAQEVQRSGAVGQELLLEGGRSVVLVVNGEGETHLGRFGARTERGLRLTVFAKDWSERVNRTFDTWASLSEANALAGELARCTPSETVVITSFDAWERCFHHSLAQELSRCSASIRVLGSKGGGGRGGWVGTGVNSACLQGHVRTECWIPCVS
jgi:hypothetical protein